MPSHGLPNKNAEDPETQMLAAFYQPVCVRLKLLKNPQSQWENLIVSH
jgi:hypothetical protein